MCVYISAILLSETAYLVSMCKESASPYVLRMSEEFVCAYELHMLRYKLLANQL